MLWWHFSTTIKYSVNLSGLSHCYEEDLLFDCNTNDWTVFMLWGPRSQWLWHRNVFHHCSKRMPSTAHSLLFLSKTDLPFLSSIIKLWTKLPRGAITEPAGSGIRLREGCQWLYCEFKEWERSDEHGEEGSESVNMGCHTWFAFFLTWSLYQLQLFKNTDRKCCWQLLKLNGEIWIT